MAVQVMAAVKKILSCAALLVCLWVPEKAQGAAFNPPLIVSDREIQLTGLPPHRAAYNPSMIAYGRGALMAFRIDGTDGSDSVRVGIVQLDEDFLQQGEPTILDLRPPGLRRHTTEDPRLIQVDDDIYLVYNYVQKDSSDRPRKLAVARLDITSSGPQGIVVQVPARAGLSVPAGHASREIEKNWTPFVKDHALYFIYNTNPPDIMRLPQGGIQDGFDTIELQQVSREAREIHWDHGEMRGGTAAVWDAQKQRFYAFFHGKYFQWQGMLQKYFANIGFYTFLGEAPFEIDSLLADNIEPQKLHDSDTTTLSCAYPGGFLVRDDSTYLAFGWQDFSIHILQLDTDVLWSSLQKVSQP